MQSPPAEKQKAAERWVRNRSDELAIGAGCCFDESRAEHVCKFFESMLVLYEGEWAGQKFALMPWQRELLSRAFGWMRWSDHFQRWVRRFRKVSFWAPKKSGKSPLAAGVGLYLLTRDGEQGQKVWSGARDGKQAHVVHLHALRMVERSEVLSRECSINKSTGRITHWPTQSYYEILAGDNIESQEGLNGSIIIDETHVVDDRLAKVLEYMGASRAEPLQFEISTVGDDPESYGRKQYEYGKSVERGEQPDPQFLFMSYEAPQDLTDEQAMDPKVWRGANPSWGRIIDEAEFSSSLKRAKRSMSDWVKFKQYRLNVWAVSSNPWLSIDDWARCGQRYTESDLEGQQCWMGLDLSKTQDMTAAVLIFPGDDGHYRMLPYFWLPEEVAREKNHLAPYLEWASQGHLELTPGNVVDYRYVTRRVCELAEKFVVGGIYYDKTYAEQVTQEINEQTGVERVIFPQKVMAFAGPTAGFEAAVIAGKLHHPQHPILTWQAGHVQVYQDVNGNKRPIKPKHQDARKIDGIVAAIMAFEGARTGPAVEVGGGIEFW